MGLASLRQQTTLRRSEECLNTSTPESSSSESPDETDNNEPTPIWTRQIPPVYGRGPPPADTDTLPSSEEDDYRNVTNVLSPQSEEDHGHGVLMTSGSGGAASTAGRIFVKNANGGFIGVTPNQLQSMQITSRQSPSAGKRRMLPKNNLHC